MHPNSRSFFMTFGLLVIALLYAARPVAAAEGNELQISEVKRIGDRIVVDVFTPGGPVLEADEFNVSMNDLETKVVDATPTESSIASLGVVLVIDTSGSMQGRPMANAKTAVGRFIDVLDPDDQVALVRFSTTVETVSPFTDDHAATAQAVQRLTPGGETAVYDGVTRAIELVEDRPPLQRNIILLTDGADTASDTSFQATLAAARHAGATVSIVAVRSPEYAPGSIKPLAAQTGGRLVETDDVSQLSGLFEDLARVLASNYQIEFADPDPLASTADLRIKVNTSAGVLNGRKVVSMPVLFSEDGRSARDSLVPFEIPLPVFLAGVFIGVGTVAFIGTAALRRRKSSPLDRIDWYVDKPNAEIDSDVLINAAVLQRAKDLATNLAGRTGYLESFEREIEGAGMKWRAGEAIVLSLLAAIVGGFLGFVVKGLPAGLIGMVVGAVGPTLFIKNKAAKRRKAFYKQLSDVLVLLTGGLRAGYSMQQAAGAVANDASPPASEEFRRVMAEVRLGASLDDALKAMARRVKIVDFDWTILAIEIQREVGGDLSEILDTIAETIRSRERLRGRVRTLTAEGRLSGIVLGSLPFAMAGFISLKNGDYLAPLWQTPKGLMMLGVSAFMMVIGIFWMKKIVDIKV